VTKIKGQKIDWLSAEMLRVLSKEGGEATTRDLTRETGAQNKKINYRYGNLESAGLIETEQPPFDRAAGQHPPKQIELTDDGRYAIKHYDLQTDDTDRLNVDDRISRLESRLTRLEDELTHAYARIDELEEKEDQDGIDEDLGWEDAEI